MNRRQFLRKMVVTSALALTGVSAIVEILARVGSPGETYQLPSPQIQPTTQTTSAGQTSSVAQTQSQTSTPAGYVLIGPASALTGKQYAYFNHPTKGSSILVDVGGNWKAFSSICTHAPCTVQYGGSSYMVCPCHGATFSTTNGGVLGGPAPVGLAEYGVQILNGSVYVTESRIN